MDQRVPPKVFFFRLANYAEYHPLLEDCFRRIETLPFTEEGRYLSTVSEDTVLAVFVTSSTYPIKIQFGRIRRSDLPLVENAGDITPLQIEQSAGIIDWSHIVIFGDGTVAAEFNRDAPRIARLGEYISFKSGSNLPGSPKFLPLFQRAILEELESFEAVTVLEIEALTSDAEAIGEADKNLGAAFKACRAAGKVKKSKIILKSVREYDNDLRGLARRLITNAFSREALTSLKAIGKTPEGRKPLDMLEEYLVSTEEFMRLDRRSRALASDHAFRALQRAYQNNKSRLSAAVSANSPW